jgi:hypothetical protein
MLIPCIKEEEFQFSFLIPICGSSSVGHEVVGGGGGGAQLGADER